MKLTANVSTATCCIDTEIKENQINRNLVLGDGVDRQGIEKTYHRTDTVSKNIVDFFKSRYFQ